METPSVGDEFNVHVLEVPSKSSSPWDGLEANINVHRGVVVDYSDDQLWIKIQINALNTKVVVPYSYSEKEKVWYTTQIGAHSWLSPPKNTLPPKRKEIILAPTLSGSD